MLERIYSGEGAREATYRQQIKPELVEVNRKYYEALMAQLYALSRAVTNAVCDSEQPQHDLAEECEADSVETMLHRLTKAFEART